VLDISLILAKCITCNFLRCHSFLSRSLFASFINYFAPCHRDSSACYSSSEYDTISYDSCHSLIWYFLCRRLHYGLCCQLLFLIFFSHMLSLQLAFFTYRPQTAPFLPYCSDDKFPCEGTVMGIRYLTKTKSMCSRMFSSIIRIKKQKWVLELIMSWYPLILYP
jgi:hypothetical protein